MAKPKKKKKKKTRGWKPVPKPNGEHMPVCSTVGCTRRVSDARKTKCRVCLARPNSTTTTVYQRGHYYEDYMD